MSDTTSGAAASRPVRTRIAPSPTGFLHLGTARTALYSWAYARHHGGKFILRIEDTDVARSTQESTQQILDSMHWLGLDYDEGPFYQMQRLERYAEVVQQMLAQGTAYRCYCTPQELDAMREAQKARGEKTGYDRRWRPEPGKALPAVPEGVQPVIRFANPVAGPVVWDDMVKGHIAIDNREIDDLIIMRGDGVPTYNFAVVVDDADMAITHVFRGDEHINNTPWQINMFKALGYELPQFGHFPVILGDDGLKLSKRRGAVSVTAYQDAGYLPEGMLNYLARLGWSHGDEEIFSREQLVAWFDGSHLNKAPAQWDAAKLAWVNGHHLKALSLEALTEAALPFVGRLLSEAERSAWNPADPRWSQRVALLRDRCSTLVELAQWLQMYAGAVTPSAEDVAQHVGEGVRPALQSLRERLQALKAQEDGAAEGDTAQWNAANVSAAIKATLAEHGLKMPQLAHAVRVLVCGRSQTPSVDQILALFDPQQVLDRLQGQ